MGEFYSHLTVGKELFEAIKCPTPVMEGDRDRSNSVQHVVNTWLMIPNSQLSIIPNCTHTVFLENFSAVWTSIVPFLQQ
jgi:pimeloyl-ACP methyl ester carboxylesterase